MHHSVGRSNTVPNKSKNSWLDLQKAVNLRKKVCKIFSLFFMVSLWKLVHWTLHYQLTLSFNQTYISATLSLHFVCFCDSRCLYRVCMLAALPILLLVLVSVLPVALWVLLKLNEENFDIQSSLTYYCGTRLHHKTFYGSA